jgi:YD repeat-containing protein
MNGRGYTTTQIFDALDRKNVVQTNTWDIHGRLIGKTKGSLPQSFTYNANGDLLTMTDASGTNTRTYDSLDRVTQEDRPPS